MRKPSILFHGYSKNFIKWIKIFNTDITAYVIQCGFLSKPINIRRGCRQGDPISAYLLLIGAEILSRLIQINPNIIGIKVENMEFKLTQFADDTTLILDGSQHSLQSALNTLEIYRNISGLKMNKEKTKVIWIGRKKISKDKLNVSVDLEWGCTDFTLLGIEFSTNLPKIMEHNYAKALEKIKKLVKMWNSRYLTPFGKITVIKTNVLSQCVHLLSSIQRSDSFLKAANNILYKFLWNGKPDKIRRTTVCSNCMQGGLKMINIYNFEKAIKVSWVKKLITQPNSQWYKLLEAMYGNIDQIVTFGDKWYSKILPKIRNQFWQNILKDWNVLVKIQKPKNNSEIFRNCLWYNSYISGTMPFFPDWYKKGVYLVGDIISPDGNILTIEEIKYKFNFNPNILNYYSIKVKIQDFMSRHKLSGNWTLEKPTYPFHLDVLFRSKKGCKKFYDIHNDLGTQNDNPICETMWSKLVSNENLEITLKERMESNYKICFYSVLDNNLIWFQYRVLFKILGTKDYLKKLKLNMNSQCLFCKQYEENLEHLFCKCGEVIKLWENVRQWISNKLGFNLIITKLMKILGYLTNDENFWALNLILMVTRKYIFWCSKNGFMLNIYFLQKEIKKTFLEQETLSRVNLRFDQFNRRWNFWKKFFEGIEIQ